MGLNGTYVAYPGDDDIVTVVPAFLGRDLELLATAAAGWQLWLVDGDVADIALDTLAPGGGPVLTGLVIDSDTVHVRAAGPGDSRWETWLDLPVAVTYMLVPEMPAPSVYDADGNFGGDDWDDPVFRPAWDAAYAARMAACVAAHPRGAEGAEIAAAWALGAGLSPRPDELAAALDDHEVFAEELFERLLDGLGLAWSPIGVDGR